MNDAARPALLKPADLQAFMLQNGIQGELLTLPVPTPTVEAAAEAVGAQPEQIVKSILFSIDEQPLLAVACGRARIDRRQIASFYGVGRKRVKLAPVDVVLAVTGYEVGAMPPFGHRQPLPTLLDPHVLEFETVFAGGGAENVLVRLRSQEILVAVKAAGAAHAARAALESSAVRHTRECLLAIQEPPEDSGAAAQAGKSTGENPWKAPQR